MGDLGIEKTNNLYIKKPTTNLRNAKQPFVRQTVTDSFFELICHILSAGLSKGRNDSNKKEISSFQLYWVVKPQTFYNYHYFQ